MSGMVIFGGKGGVSWEGGQMSYIHHVSHYVHIVGLRD